MQTLRMTETGQVIPVQSWNRNGGPRGEKTTEISIDSLNSLFREGTLLSLLAFEVNLKQVYDSESFTTAQNRLFSGPAKGW